MNPPSLIRYAFHYVFKFIFLFPCFFFCLTNAICAGQNFTDSLRLKSIPKHSPKVATICSAVIPGLGQVYNKKYWKVPLIYGGMGALLYVASNSNAMYGVYKESYRVRVDTTSTAEELEFTQRKFSNEQLVINKEQYRKTRDLSYIFCGLLYVINIVDAAVDAHFYSFDVGDNLSFRLAPGVFQSNLIPVVKIGFRF